MAQIQNLFVHSAFSPVKQTFIEHLLYTDWWGSFCFQGTPNLVGRQPLKTYLGYSVKQEILVNIFFNHVEIYRCQIKEKVINSTLGSQARLCRIGGLWSKFWEMSGFVWWSAEGQDFPCRMDSICKGMEKWNTLGEQLVKFFWGLNGELLHDRSQLEGAYVVFQGLWLYSAGHEKSVKMFLN